MAERVELFRTLIKQHQALSDLLSKLADEPEQRPALLPKLERQLLAHAKAEEQTLYAATLSAGGKAAAPEIEESTREHQQMGELLQELGSLDPNDEGWEEALQTLTELVVDHVEEEESDVFELARRVLDDDTLDSLAKSFQAQYQQGLMALGVEPDDQD